MAQQLEPERVELTDIPEWIRQSHALVRRRWVFFFGLCVVHVLVSSLTQKMGYLTLPLGYIVTLSFLVIFIIAARSSDESVALSFAALVKLLQKVVVHLVILALLISVITLVAVVMGSWLAPMVPEAMTSNATVRAATNGPGALMLLAHWAAPGAMRFFVIFLSLAISGMWFLLPLLSFHSLSLLESALLSKKAERVNISVMLVVAYGPLFTLIVLMLLHDFTYLLTALLIPYFGAIQYVSYRHVFTQRKMNSPARALSPALQSSTA